MEPHFAELFDGEVDWDGVEASRGEVRAADLPSIAEYYQSLGDDWPRKVAVVQLVQDQSEPRLEPIMRDVLRAPATGTWLDDTIELTKAIALGFLSEEHDRFMHYYNDRPALAKDVAAYLAASGLRVEASTTPPRRQRPPVAPGASLEEHMREAIASGDQLATLAALDDGFDIDAPLSHPNLGPETAPPLIFALIMNRVPLAHALLCRGASVTAARPGGQTALWWAASLGDAGLVARLLELGADPNACDQHGGSPLRQAVGGGVDVTRALLDAGAQIDPPIYDGRTPIWFAAYEGRTEIVALLLDRGVPIDRPQAGKTVLHLAARENHADLVRMLLARGADPDSISAEGLTPLMDAARRGYPRIVKLLVEAGADPTRTARAGRYEGQTALDLATGRRADDVRAALCA